MSILALLGPLRSRFSVVSGWWVVLLSLCFSLLSVAALSSVFLLLFSSLLLVLAWSVVSRFRRRCRRRRAFPVLFFASVVSSFHPVRAFVHLVSRPRALFPSSGCVVAAVVSRPSLVGLVP